MPVACNQLALPRIRKYRKVGNKTEALMAGTIMMNDLQRHSRELVEAGRRAGRLLPGPIRRYCQERSGRTDREWRMKAPSGDAERPGKIATDE